MYHLLILLVVSLCCIHAALSAEDSVNFLSIGDWGGIPYPPYHTPGQKAASKGMAKIATEIDSEFVLALGDNFYFSGVENADSKRFEETFQKVYTGESLMTPWYVIAGNHDHKGNVSAQIEYTGLEANTNNRWQFPSLYHSKSFTSSGSAVKVDVILLDTIDLCDMNQAASEEEPGYFDPLPLRTRGDAADNGAQWSWLEQQMAASTADYLIVGGHFPVYSVCDHGPNPTLIEHLRPLLIQYGAHYLSGHDHCMIHMQEPGEAVNYVLSGIGDTCCYESSNKENTLNPSDPSYLKWYIAKDNNGHIFDNLVTGGFTSFQASKERMQINYHDQDGKVLFAADPVAPRVVPAPAVSV